MLTIVLLVVSLTASAQADTAVTCVQEQLAALGQDPGPADGQFGKKTQLAFAALKAAEPGKIEAITAPPFSAKSAEEWCGALAEAFSAAAPIYEAYRDQATDGFSFEIASNVPPARVAEIKQALDLVRAYIAKTFGAEIPLEVRQQMTVKIVATGKGNQEPGGGGGVATAFSEGYRYPRPFFDVANSQWNQDSNSGWTVKSANMRIVAHEYTHAWQSIMGALDLHNQVLGNWMNEGIAEYVSFKAMEDAGLMRWSDVLRHQRFAASGVQTEYALAEYGSTQTRAWPGHVGFFAIDWLVRDNPNGMDALKTIAGLVGSGKNQREAFAGAFGLELSSFYDQFEPWRQAFLKDPARAVANRPRLILAGASGSSDLPASDPLAAEKCVQAGLSANGFKVGTVDGQIGSGTRAAFETYKRSQSAMFQSIPFGKSTYALWCLILTANSPLTGALAPLQEEVESRAKATASFKIAQSARFAVLMRRGEEELARIDQPDWNEVDGEFSVEFDYAAVRQADNICAVFNDGWLVKDGAGNTYEGSCDQVVPAMLTASRAVWSYDLVEPAPPPAPVTSAPADSESHLSTVGDPNPGVDLIPNGWDGVFKTADQSAGRWKAEKYSGEVIDYANCRLLNDTYIICQ